MRVVLADLDGMARRALATLVREQAGVVLVREVGTRPALARSLRDDRPEILIIDDRLIEDGLHLLAGSGPMHRVPRVIVVGVDDDPAFAARAARLGGSAWVAKDRAYEDLVGLLVEP